MSDVILQANGILKRYPGNVALDHVDFKLHRNAVNVLIGENGAHGAHVQYDEPSGEDLTRR